MKIVALGGAGQEGSTTVRVLAEDPRVTELVVADLNLAAAQQLVKSIGRNKVYAAQVDVTDRQALLDLMQGADSVANFVGPFYLFGPPTLDAAIEAGVNYVDICDDVEAIEACLERDAIARKAGVTAVVGLGASPGLANILARRGSDMLDVTEEIHVRWQVSLTDVEQVGESAALYHFFHAVDGDVPQFLDGELVMVPAYSGEETVKFSSIGERKAFFTAHPEPVTLSRYIPGLRNVTCKGGVAGLDEAVLALRALGLTSDNPIEMDGVKISPRRYAMALLERLPDPDPLPTAESGLQVTIKGQIAGRNQEIVFDIMSPTRMSPITGIPTAIGAVLVAQKSVVSPGVAAPEAVFDAADFIEELVLHGIEISQITKETSPC